MHGGASERVHDEGRNRCSIGGARAINTRIVTTPLRDERAQRRAGASLATTVQSLSGDTPRGPARSQRGVVPGRQPGGELWSPCPAAARSPTRPGGRMQAHGDYTPLVSRRGFAGFRGSAREVSRKPSAPGVPRARVRVHADAKIGDDLERGFNAGFAPPRVSRAPLLVTGRDRQWDRSSCPALPVHPARADAQARVTCDAGWRRSASMAPDAALDVRCDRTRWRDLSDAHLHHMDT